MSTFFILLFFFLLAALAAGLASPRLLGRAARQTFSRKQIALLFGGAALVALILGAVTAPAKQAATNTTTSQTIVQMGGGATETVAADDDSKTATATVALPDGPAPAPPPPQQAAQPASGCDESLWNHVYHPSRLRRIEDCKTITGTVASIRKEADGDYHINLAVDAPYAGMINQRNIEGEHGDLVLEPVCQNAVRQEDAKDACAGFSYPITIPAVGQRVTVTGDFVLDAEHGWNELHPVYSFTVDGGQVAPAAIAASPPTPPPAPAPSPDAAAQAGIPCADGTVSHAQHRQGACSHHGGIAPGY